MKKYDRRLPIYSGPGGILSQRRRPGLSIEQEVDEMIRESRRKTNSLLIAIGGFVIAGALAYAVINSMSQYSQ